MKTTENISLAGYAFTIEEDAYKELSEYLNDIRRSFGNDASAQEITEDIEERIAELLSERCCSGMVVNISMIREIKKRIGAPEELGGESTEDTDAEVKVEEEKKSWRNRRIYRNIDERILGGVCGGLGAYFGIDKVIFRVLFLIFFCIGFADEGLFCIPMVLYICLWIAMPAARTVEQKCEMKGKPVDLTGFRTKEFDVRKEVKEASDSPAGKAIRRTGGIFIGIILLIAGLCGLLGCIFIPSLPSIIENGASYICEFDIMDHAGILIDTTFWNLVTVSGVIASIGMLYGGIMLAFDLKAPSWRPGLVLFIAWVISMFATAAWTIKALAEYLIFL